MAHLERYSYFYNNYGKYKKLKEAGCLFQLNFLSLPTYYGKSVQVLAFKLLKDYIGPDTHIHKHLYFLEKIGDAKTMKLIELVLYPFNFSLL